MSDTKFNNPAYQQHCHRIAKRELPSPRRFLVVWNHITAMSWSKVYDWNPTSVSFPNGTFGSRWKAGTLAGDSWQVDSLVRLMTLKASVCVSSPHLASSHALPYWFSIIDGGPKYQLWTTMMSEASSFNDPIIQAIKLIKGDPALSVLVCLSGLLSGYRRNPVFVSYRRCCNDLTQVQVNTRWQLWRTTSIWVRIFKKMIHMPWDSLRRRSRNCLMTSSRVVKSDYGQSDNLSFSPDLPSSVSLVRLSSHPAFNRRQFVKMDRKPDPRFYQYALDRLGVEAREVVFLDDIGSVKVFFALHLLIWNILNLVTHWPKNQHKT